jgi:hypothetical protein
MVVVVVVVVVCGVCVCVCVCVCVRGVLWLGDVVVHTAKSYFRS